MTKQYKKFRTQMHMTFGKIPKENKSLAEEYFAFVDLFAGAGGVTTGAESAEVEGKKVADVICAINHDRKAIESHWQNHPHVKHFVEDIKKFDVNDLPKVSDPRARKFLWASLECTNFSNAKGGLPRDADSRTLGNHLPRYVSAYDPDYIGIENVREFRDWGPLIHMVDENGKKLFLPNRKPMMMPDKTKLGRDYRRWVKKMCSLGYHYQERILNSADFGAHTSRRRLFIIFAKHGLPIEWPVPTHSKDGAGGKDRWRPVKECLDFSNKGQNIFGRKKNLSDNTYKRIYAGLVKFIAKGDESFITKYLGNNEFTGVNNGKSVDEPSVTITTQNRLALVQPEFLVKYHGNGKNIVDTNGPASSITTKDRLGLVQSDFLLNYQHSSDANSTDKPSPTIVTKDKYGLVQTEQFLVNPQYDSAGSSIDKPAPTLIARQDKRPISIVQTEQFLAIHNTAKKGHNPGRSIEQPGPALTTKPTARLVAVDRFIDMQHSQGKQNESIDGPAGAITTVPKKNLVTVEHFVDQQHGQSKPQSIDLPSNTILGNPKQNLVSAFIMNTNYTNVGRDLSEAMFSLVASRRHPYLVQLETGDIAITIDKGDTEIMRRIKMFMAAYGVIAIYMRMLTVPELLRITGLPEDYILEGTQGDAKKFIGNAVPPVLPKVMIEALAKSLQKQKNAKAA